ncbi:hypothetical protein PR202_gb03180 [Eleusine coracana subsp. coracana]|uniref:CCHC-type domain-containing protein n=1 Tax=Eleusine coracana subsp. coracana TaxID=191504 RepID=A0AAV5E0J5_ELECO|nr:hypothetical protein PR202_gb03180 [Eleusine coracana subsp. coracana]
MVMDNAGIMLPTILYGGEFRKGLQESLIMRMVSWFVMMRCSYLKRGAIHDAQDTSPRTPLTQEEYHPRRKAKYKKRRYFNKEKGKGKGLKKKFSCKALVGEWTSDNSSESSSSSSDDDEVAGLAMIKTTLPRVLPPPRMCLMATSQHGESEDESSDDSDVEEPSCAVLWSMLEQARDIAVKKSKILEVGDDVELREKYEALELTLEAINVDNLASPSSSSSKSDASTMYDELTTLVEVSSFESFVLKEYHELKEERKMVMDGFERLTRGRAIHKETLGRNLVNNVSHRGFASYPTAIDIIGTSDSIPAWIKPLLANDYYCERCCKDGHTIKDCPTVRSSIALPNANLFYENPHFKIFRNEDGKVKVKALGPPNKKRKVTKGEKEHEDPKAKSRLITQRALGDSGEAKELLEEAGKQSQEERRSFSFCSAYKYYLNLGGEGNPKRKGKMNYRTHYKCVKQVSGSMHYGFYVCYYITAGTGSYTTFPSDDPPICKDVDDPPICKDPNNNPEKHNFHLPDKTLYLIGSKLLRSIMHEFIYPDGAYHDPESLVAQHPDLCDYIGYHAQALKKRYSAVEGIFLEFAARVLDNGNNSLPAASKENRHTHRASMVRFASETGFTSCTHARQAMTGDTAAHDEELTPATAVAGDQFWGDQLQVHDCAGGVPRNTEAGRQMSAAAGVSGGGGGGRSVGRRPEGRAEQCRQVVCRVCRGRGGGGGGGAGGDGGGGGAGEVAVTAGESGGGQRVWAAEQGRWRQRRGGGCGVRGGRGEAEVEVGQGRSRKRLEHRVAAAEASWWRRWPEVERGSAGASSSMCRGTRGNGDADISGEGIGSG